MDIYMAGSTFKELNGWMQEKGYNKLFSQLNDKREIKDWSDYKKSHKDSKSKLFIDSGAFTAHTKGVKIDCDEYIDYLNEYHEQFTIYAQLDDIPGEYGKPRTPQELAESPKLSWENYLYMAPRLKDKEKLLPVFHQGEDFKWLKNMLEYKDEKGNSIPYIGVAPGKDLAVKDRREWLDAVFDIIARSSNPNVKVHALGITSLWMLELYPFESADSTSWIMTAVTGSIFTPDGIVTLSEQTKGKGNNYHNLEPLIQKHIKDYVEKNGFTIEGLTEDYKQREMFNIVYLNDWANNYVYKPRNLKINMLF